MSDTVPIQSRDFWVKVVDMLQQNWALIEPMGSKVTIYFLHDLGGVFDELTYSSLCKAQAALRWAASWIPNDLQLAELCCTEPSWWRARNEADIARVKITSIEALSDLSGGAFAATLVAFGNEERLRASFPDNSHEFRTGFAFSQESQTSWGACIG